MDRAALEGTVPVAVMESLADDDDFTGKLIVGVAPGLFFSGYEYRRSALDRYPEESPTQWFSHKVSVLSEPYLAFYNYDFAFPTILRRQPVPARDGVVMDLDVRKLSNMERDRNTRLWDKPVYNEEYRQKQLDRAIAATKKLQAKGVDVIFVQMPYGGHYAVAEIDIAPRELTWDVLLEQGGAQGLHFQDHEEMQGYYLPEWSHMTGEEADRFTEAFYGLVQRELAARKAAGGEL